MNIKTNFELLRIFIGENQKHGHRPLYEVIVREAQKRGLAGATVVRGIMGFGKNSQIRTSKILRLSEDLPLVIEIVDEPERIASFLPHLDAITKQGLVTLEKVRVIINRHNRETKN